MFLSSLPLPPFVEHVSVDWVDKAIIAKWYIFVNYFIVEKDFFAILSTALRNLLTNITIPEGLLEYFWTIISGIFSVLCKCFREYLLMRNPEKGKGQPAEMYGCPAAAGDVWDRGYRSLYGKPAH